MKALLPALLLLGSLGVSLGQSPVAVHGRVVDRDGQGVAQALVTARSSVATQNVRSGEDGSFVVAFSLAVESVDLLAISGNSSTPTLHVPRAAFGTDLMLVLAVSTVTQQVNVVATRSSVEMGPSGRVITLIGAQELQQYPALTLDDQLRQHAGLELFRRSSGWVQNPTSQGISLRGLGSTAASRTLVLADGAPLNDPFGGWIHWNEIPPEAIEAVTIASGGGSDLYGSSALGGVIDVLPGRPMSDLAEISASGASEDTASASGRTDLRQSHWGELVAGQYFRTDGYILTAPPLRGAVDVPANVHFQTGRVNLERRLGEARRAFLIGNVLNEARSNGTPDQTNGTRLWRYLAGNDWTVPGALRESLSGRVRLFGSDEAYRQSFSAIALNRASERLTRQQNVGTQELGGSADASFHLTHVAFVAGADVRDLRATDLEVPMTLGVPTGVQDTTARQRFVGGFGEALAERGAWSGTVSLRADRAQNLAASTLSQTAGSPAATTPIPDRSEVVLSPRLGLVRRVGTQVNLHASAFRAFRSPTMNELYRTGQVGQETTLANSALVSERATGAEGGVGWTRPRLALDATYFWTGINRPVSALLLRSTATTITEMRENLGQIQSQGMQLDLRVNEGRTLSADLGYQYAHAVVTAFSAQSTLVGNWIPDVPRESATAQLRAQSRRLGAATLALRESGRAYDDSANTFVLHGFFTMALYGERSFAKHWSVFVSGENLLGRKVDVARTPILTLGTPFILQGGARLQWGAGAK